jgi:hypothetical protein
MTCCKRCKYGDDGCSGGRSLQVWNHWIINGVVSGGDYNSKDVSHNHFLLGSFKKNVMAVPNPMNISKCRSTFIFSSTLTVLSFKVFFPFLQINTTCVCLFNFVTFHFFNLSICLFQNISLQFHHVARVANHTTSPGRPSATSTAPTPNTALRTMMTNGLAVHFTE